MNSIKKILIVDDHPIVSWGLHYQISLNFQDCVVTEVWSLQLMYEALLAGNFTHMILDLHLGDGNSIYVLPELVKQYPHLKILICSMAPEGLYARKLLQLGTSGFLSKSADEKETIRALDIFLQGGIYVSKVLVLLDKGEIENYNVFYRLSIKELRVLGFMLKGYKTKVIAANLDIQPQTITKYKSRIFGKFRTENLFDIRKLAELYNISFP